MCSGRLTTSKTTSGEASTWMFRSIVPSSMTCSMSMSFRNLWLHNRTTVQSDVQPLVAHCSIARLAGMKTRNLGGSGLKISEIAYGNWLTHGSQVEEDAATACVRQALDEGITTFDTADVYANTK